MKPLLLALLVPAFSLADITEQEMQKQMKAASEAAASAESELPPCEGHDHLEDVVRRFAPPSSCQKARQFFDYYIQHSQKIRDNCREASRWAEEQLRQPDFCSSEVGRQAAHKKLSAFRQDASADEESDEADALLDGAPLEYYLDGSESRPQAGEWARLECGQGVRLALQLRTKQRGLANKHFGMADYALDSVCEEGPKGADEYLDFLRKGEDGL